MAAILRLAEVEKRTGLRKSSIYPLIRNGEFPAPVQLGPRASGWVDTDIDSWIQSRTRGARPWGKAAQGKAD